MNGGFHTIKTDSEHRLRAREAFDPQKHRRDVLSEWQLTRRKRRQTLWMSGAAAVFACALFAAWEPSSAWRAERAADALLEAEAARETRRLHLASDDAFRRESLVSDGRAAIVVNSHMAAPLIAPLEEPFREYAGRTYSRQLLRHGAVAQFLSLCGSAEVRDVYLARNARAASEQHRYRARAEADALPPVHVPDTVDSDRCGDVAAQAEAGHYDLRLD